MSAPAVIRAFELQSNACTRLGSPFTSRICRIFSERLNTSTPLAENLLDWPGDPTANGDNVPLRLCGALHALVRAAPESDLAKIYPPQRPPGSDDAIWELLENALAQNGEFIIERLRFAPQTNEIGRSSVLYFGLAHLATRYDLPIVLSELGASAGLNLLCDQYAYQVNGETVGHPENGILLQPEWQGEEPSRRIPVIAERHGCDVNPLDVHDNGDMQRLQSFIWPDQTDRLRRTETAIGLARRFLAPSAVDRCDAAEWLEKRLAIRQDGRLHVVMHTIAWQYFSTTIQEICRELIVKAGDKASDEAPLAWLSLEAADKHGASIFLQTWPVGQALEIGRADYHGRWIDWRVTANPK